MSSKSARLSVEMPENEHKKLKILAEASGLTLKEFVLKLIRPVLYPSKYPNATTQETIEQTEKGEHLVACKNVEDLWEQLGLNK